MKSRRSTIAIRIAGVAIFIGLWAFFAPVKLGGSVTYSITDGISMQPLLYKNDLALIKPATSYHVGDIVLYNSQVLHRQVLHRIYLIQNGNYFFKGDNNDFVDPGYATRSELVGKMWFHIPWIGCVLTWFGKPAHAAPLAVFAALAVAFASLGGTPRRRRRRRRASTYGQRAVLAVTPGQEGVGSSDKPPVERRSDRRQSTGANPRSGPERRSRITLTPRQVATRRSPSYFDGPTSTLVVVGALLLGAFLFLAIGFSRPLQRTVPQLDAYRQSGTFSYSAAVKKPTAVYPSGFVSTGQPIYPNLVNDVVMSFSYKFESTLPHHIKGTIGLRALLLSQANTWQRLSTVTKATPFVGDSASLHSSLPLSGLYALINSVSAQSGTALDYLADIQPVVHITGTVGSETINETFAPVLPFQVAASEIDLDVQATPPPPGATYIAPSPTSELALALHPTEATSVPHLVSNVISIAKYDVSVPFLRQLGIVFAGLAVLFGLLHDFVRRRKTLPSDEEVLSKRFHSLIVPLVALPVPLGTTEFDVADFAHLAELAKYLERPILYEINHDMRTFAVDDDFRRYVYRPKEVEASAPAAPEPPPTTDNRAALAGAASPGRGKRKIVIRAGAAVLVFAVIITMSISFTASTNVPISNAGTSAHAVSIAELTPTGCSSLALTTMVEKSGTFSNSTSHVLILGSSGVDKITDTGYGNCIVGGAGKDTVTGTSTDICIVGPTSGATYKTCTTS